MADLYLRVKRKWFDQIKAGIKPEEYRLDKESWQKKLIGREYDRVVVVWGYPKKTEQQWYLYFPWQGYTMKTVVSEEWKNVPQRVFAIKLYDSQ